MGKQVTASRGLSMVRCWDQAIDVPPNTFTIGAASYSSVIRNLRGLGCIRAAVVNDTTGTLQVITSWRVGGAYSIAKSMTTTLDALSGYYVNDALVPVAKPFTYLKFVGTLGTNFELGGYATPC